MDSTAVTISTTISDTTAITSKRGAPKANGDVNPIQSASPTRPKSVSPASHATTVPATSPSSTAMVLQKPRKNLCINTIAAMVPSAYMSQRPLPGSCAATGLCGLRVASPIPTGSSDTPMMVITEPVTTGGKNRMSRAKNGAIRKVNAPAAMTAPYTVSNPTLPPPWSLAILITGARVAKVTPCSSGSLTPIFQNPTACRIEATPQVNRSAVINMVSASASRSMARAMSNGTNTAPA